MRQYIHRKLLTLLSPGGPRARLMIFGFHRVLEQADPLLSNEPDRALFGEILRWIGDMCVVLPLSTAVAAMRFGGLPARAAAITFDDGYRNNLTVAKPLLVEAGLPATVFIAVDAVRKGVMWNDLVIEAVRQRRGEIDVSDFGFDVDSTRGLDDAKLIGALITGLKYRPIEQRSEAASELYERVVGHAPPRLMLSEDEVAELAGDGIELGAHTVHHPILTRLPDDIAHKEIQDSRTWLRERTGETPSLFAYPNGQPGTDYDHRHVAMVRDIGFAAAVSTRWGVASATSTPFELPRFTPWERRRDEFELRLAKVCARSYGFRGSG